MSLVLVSASVQFLPVVLPQACSVILKYRYTRLVWFVCGWQAKLWWCDPIVSCCMGHSLSEHFKR